MDETQVGIFAMGTSSHLFLEMDRLPGKDARSLLLSVEERLRERTTTAGTNLVAGIRPELWRGVQPKSIPAGLAGFDQDLVAPDGYRMPALQHDLFLWYSGSSNDVVYDEAERAIRRLRPLASVVDETAGWSYHHDRDLTGFIDGTENPSLAEAREVATIPEGKSGAGGSVLLFQKWKHNGSEWASLPTDTQEHVIGRRKSDSEELSPRPVDSHVRRTDQDAFGKIFRRNVSYGSPSDHGTLFVGFCADQGPLLEMLRSMLGMADGHRDALTRYTTPLNGAFYFVPSPSAFRSLVQSEAPHHSP